MTIILLILFLAALLLLTLILLGVLWLFLRKRKPGTGGTPQDAGQTVVQQSQLPEPWRALRAEVLASERSLTERVYHLAHQVFQETNAEEQVSPVRLTLEYESQEFLLVLDAQGRPTGLGNFQDEFQADVAKDPTFAHWFQSAHLPDGNVLLAARWLCHLVGLRHGTVEIFIDPPHLVGHTLVQVRGMEKFEAPGAFDIPCAGHISGMDTPEEALRKELAEELNLILDNLGDIRQVKQYNSYTENAANGMLNNEYRVLYQARLLASAAAEIRFADGEVAGLGVFSIDELRELARRYPERIASGLGDALEYYQDIRIGI